MTIESGIPYNRSIPLTEKGKYKLDTFEEAQKLARKTDGSEAIYKYQDEKSGATFYTVNPVDQQTIRAFNQTELDPKLLCFSIDKQPNSTKNPETFVSATEQAKENLKLDLAEIENSTDEQLKDNPRLDRAAQSQGYESALAYKHATKEFEAEISSFNEAIHAHLTTMFKGDGPDMLQSLKTQYKSFRLDAQAIGFSDLKTLNTQLKQLPPSQRDEITKILRDMKLSPTQKNQLAAELFKKEFGVDVNLSKEQWSGAGVVALLDAFNKLKEHSPDQLAAAAKIKFVYETKTTQNTKAYEMSFMELLNNNMKIAHTCTAECVVTLHEGAVKGTSGSVIQDKAAVLEQKLAILDRKLSKCGYSKEEMKARDLGPGNDSNDRKQDLTPLKSLFSKFTQVTPASQGTYFQMAALLRAMEVNGTSFGDIKALVPSLKAFFPSTDLERELKGGVDVILNHLKDRFLGENPPEPALLAAIQADITKVLDNMSYAKLTDAVFVAEKMHETRSLQAFLNNTNPPDVADLPLDGELSKQTNKEIARFQLTVVTKLIENKLPKPPDPKALQALDKIKAQLFDGHLSKNDVGKDIQKLIGAEIPGLSKADNAEFNKSVAAIYENVQLGKFDSATLHSLINSWLQMVDGNREGQIGSDLILHEIGHNIMQQKIYSKDATNVSTALTPSTLQSDWNAIGGFSQGANDFSLENATESFLTSEKEEVSDYGQTNGSEDFAEAFRLYNSNPKELLVKAPTKFLMLNALVNNKPEDAQKKLDETIADIKRSGKRIDLKPSLDKILGFDPTSKTHISPQMVEKLTQTYAAQFKGYIPPNPLEGSSLSQSASFRKNPSVPGGQKIELGNAVNRILDVYEAVKTLMKHVPAPVGAKFDEVKLKELLGHEQYNRLPEAFKVILSNQDSSPLTDYLLQPTTPACSPELMATNLLQELNQRESTQHKSDDYDKLLNDELPDFLYGLADEEAIDALLHDVQTETASDNLLKVVDKLNMIIQRYNETHFAHKGEMVDIHSPKLEEFLTQLPNILKNEPDAFVQFVKTTFDLS